MRSARSASARWVRHRVWATTTPHAMRASTAAAAAPIGAAATAGGSTAAARTVDGRGGAARGPEGADGGRVGLLQACSTSARPAARRRRSRGASVAHPLPAGGVWRQRLDGASTAAAPS